MFITWLGAPMNYHTGACEHNHKYQAKRPGRRAAKNHKTFIKSVARNLVDGHVIDVFVDLLNKHANEVINYEVIVNSDDDDVVAENDEGVQESNAGATTCHICVRDNQIVVEWNSRSAVPPSASHGLVRFIANHFGLHQDAAKSVTLYTQYKRVPL